MSVPSAVLWVGSTCTLASVALSTWSIARHLYSYQRPALQRLVVRIMLMIPIYAVASLASLTSVRAAFFIDLVRDLYEAFVIYTFFTLLLSYLGGPRSLLTLLHSSLRPPTPHPFPMHLVLAPLDLSDPHSYLALKRGVLQYCVVKPGLAAVSAGLKLGHVYGEGELGLANGWTWVSVVYNTSICLSLYCLAMFWVTIHADVRPFRPTPKFLCVKGILFFSFWQSIAVSLVVKWGWVRSLGGLTDQEHISLALNNVLISAEMPLFALAHTYAFCVLSDYVDPALSYTARLPLSLALRDAFGVLDLYYDVVLTIKGSGMSYRSFEPSGAEWGVVRPGPGRERRLRDGLRYVGGGKGGAKYWLPEEDVLKVAAVGGYGAVGGGGGGGGARSPTGGVGVGGRPHLHPVLGGQRGSGGHRSPTSPALGSPRSAASAPLLGHHAHPYHPHPLVALNDGLDTDSSSVSSLDFSDGDDEDEDGPSAAASVSASSSATGGNSGGGGGGGGGVGGPDGQDGLYAEARGFLHGDWAYSVVVDVSKEAARRRMRQEEENVLRGLGRTGRGRRQGERWGGPPPPDTAAAAAAAARAGSKGKGKGRRGVYGAWLGDHDDPVDHEEVAEVEPPPPSLASGPWSPRRSTPSPSTDPNPAGDARPPGPSTRTTTTTTTKPTPGRQVAAGLKAVASKVVPPPPNLRFSTDELRVDLVVEDEDAWDKELSRRRRKGEPPGRPGDDAPDGIYRRPAAISPPAAPSSDADADDEAQGREDGPTQQRPIVVRPPSPSSSPSSPPALPISTSTLSSPYDDEEGGNPWH